MGATSTVFLFLGIGLLVAWVCLIFAGLIIITKVLFNEEDIKLACPDVDLTKSHILDNVTYVKLNSTISSTNTITKTGMFLDTPQLGISKMSIIMFWISMFPMFIYGVIKLF